MKLLKEDVNKLDYNDVNNVDSEYKIKTIKHTMYENNIPQELVDSIKKLNSDIGIIYKKCYDTYVKPKEEEKAKQEKERLDKTSLKVQLTQQQADLIDNVLGQMSDGKWENNKAYDKYWKNIQVNGTTLTVDIDRLKYADWRPEWNKEFESVWKNPDEIKRFFARKAQMVQNEDIRDNEPGRKLRDVVDKRSHYLDGGLNQTYGQVQAAIDSLR